MGRTLTPDQEIQQLKALIREAHEVLNDLNRAMKEAKRLTPSLIAEFEMVHEREIRQVSNHLAAESNRIATVLNTHVEIARTAIMEQLTISELLYDHVNGDLRLRWKGTAFDDQQPPPYPDTPPKEETL